MNHNHISHCKHVLAFCEKCEVPYCTKCNYEWAKPCNQSHYYVNTFPSWRPLSPTITYGTPVTTSNTPQAGLLGSVTNHVRHI